MVTRVSNAKFLTVDPAIPAERLGWEVKVISPVDWSTVLAVMPRYSAISGSLVKNDFGSGSITLDSNDPALRDPLPLNLEGTVLDRECLYQFWHDGIHRHDWLGEDIVEDEVTENESVTTTISGRTTEKVLEWARHIPVWGEQQQFDLADDAVSGHFRLQFGSEVTAPIAWNANAAAIASALIGLPSIGLADVSVTQEEYTITVQFMGVFANRDVPLLRVAENALLDDEGESGPEVSFSSAEDENSWMDLHGKSLGKPAINMVIDEFERAQARGTLPFLSLTFTREFDSYGAAWSDVSDIEIGPGESLLDLLKRLSETNDWEFKMLPGFRLFLVQGEFGNRREDEVALLLGKHQRTQTKSSSTRDIATSVYTMSTDYAIARATGETTASPWKREVWLEGGGAASSTQGSKIANASLSVMKDRKVSKTYSVVPDRKGAEVFVDFGLNDWVKVEGRDYQTEPVKIVGLAWAVDGDGAYSLETTVQNRFEHRAEKVQRTLNKMGASASTGGAGTSPIRGESTSRPVSLNDLTDVDIVGVQPKPGDALVYNATLGIWEPGEVAAAGGGTTSTLYTEVHNSTTQTITGGAWTPLTFNVKDADVVGGWAAGQPTRFTAPADGVYLVSFTFSRTSTTALVSLQSLAKNGTLIDNGQRHAGAGESERTYTRPVYLDEGDYVQGMVWMASNATVSGRMLVTPFVGGVPGTPGAPGDPGAPGRSISTITRTSGTGAPGSTDTWTITYTSGSPSTFTIYNGVDGDDGDDGIGITSVALQSGDHSPGTTDVYRITFTNSTHVDFPVYNGTDGAGASAVADLTDVDLTGIADGDVLIWDAGSSQWVTGPMSGGGGGSLPPGGDEADVLVKVSSTDGDADWAPIVDLLTTPDAANFKGPWPEPDGTSELAFTQDFTSGLGYWAKQAGSPGTLVAQAKAIDNLFGSSGASYSHNLHLTSPNTAGSYAVAELDFSTVPALAGRLPVLLKFYWAHGINNAGGTGGSYEVNGATRESVSGSNRLSPPITEDATSLTVNMKLGIRAQRSSRTTLAGLEVYVEPLGEEFETGDVVTHAGSLWRSTVDSNTSEPGDNADWTEIPFSSLSYAVGYLNALDDIDLSGLDDGDILAYHSASSTWRPVPPPSGGGGGYPPSRLWTPGPGETTIDEFDDVIDPAWVRVDKAGGAGRATWAEGGSSMSVKLAGGDAGSELHAMMHPIGAALAVGDAAITAMTWSGPAVNYQIGGIVFADGVASGAGNQVVAMAYREGTQVQHTLNARAMTNYLADSATASQHLTAVHGQIYIRLVRVTSTGWRVDHSPDGVQWINGPSTVTKSVTPTHVGLFGSSWGGTTGAAGIISYEFLRRVSAIS